MHSNLAHSLDLILASEGGYCDVPGDNGGPTNMGVTLRAFQAWTSDPSATATALRAMPRSMACEVFITEYAAPVCFDELPAGLDYAVFDASVNSGPSRAAKLLQQALAMPEDEIDGVVGAKTLAACAGSAPVALVNAYCDARLAFMRQLKSWSRFGKGWTLRVEEVRRDALLVVSGASVLSMNTPKTEAPAKATGGVRLLATPSGKAALAAAFGVAVTATGMASQAVALLSPYADVSYVKLLLPVLSILAAAAPLIVAAQRALNGATT